MVKYPFCINTSSLFNGNGAYAQIISDIVGADRVISLVLDKTKRNLEYPGLKRLPKHNIPSNGYLVYGILPKWFFDLDNIKYHYLDPGIYPLSDQGIITIHDMYSPLNDPFIIQFTRSLKIRKYKRFRNVIAISNITKEVMIENGFDAENITVVHHGNSKTWKKYENRSEIRKSFGLPDDKKIAISVGDGPFKNNNLITEALKNSEFLHVHVGNEAGNVKFSSLSDYDLNRLMSASDVLIRISSQEGFGRPPMQATALGIPIVLSPLKVFKELYGEYAFFSEITKESILKTVRYAVGHIDEYLERSRPFVKYYSFEAFKERMDKFYSSVKFDD